VWARSDSEPAQEFVMLGYPVYQISEDTIALTDAWLARDGQPASLRRLVAEGRDGVVPGPEGRGARGPRRRVESGLDQPGRRGDPDRIGGVELDRLGALDAVLGAIAARREDVRVQQRASRPGSTRQKAWMPASAYSEGLRSRS
jgi:hypothetical protein